MARSEIILIDKPEGLTSMAVVRALKAAFPGEKVGHGGTLDPLASGLLIILVGQATKLFSRFQEVEKIYQAEIAFGAVTDTLDLEGKIIGKDKKKVLEEKLHLLRLEKILKGFPRRYNQKIPLYSAAKYQGKAYYWWVRQGLADKIPPKTKLVKINDLQLLSPLIFKEEFPFPFVRLRLSVSSGFYVRQFAFDLGKELGLKSFLKSLRRVAVGEYSLEEN